MRKRSLYRLRKNQGLEIRKVENRQKIPEILDQLLRSHGSAHKVIGAAMAGGLIG